MATAPFNYRDPNYAKWVADQKALTHPPDLTNGGQNTSLVTTPPLRTAPGPDHDPSRPGHYVGNQWMYDDIPITDVNGNVVPPYQPPPDPPKDPGPPPTTTTETTTSGGGGGGTTAPTNTTVSSTYSDIIQKLLGMSPPGQAGSSLTAPVRHQSAPIAYAPSEYDALIKAQIQKMLEGPTAEDAGKAAATSLPVNAYRNSILRDLDVKRAGAAEQAGVSGVDRSGGFEGQTQALKQAAGEATAKFTGEYVDKAIADRRQELQQALQMAQQQGNFEDAQRLSAELARLQHDEEMYKSDLSLYNTNVNAELTRQQLANQAYATEVQKLLGLSDVEMRGFLGQMQNSTNLYGINTTANTQLNQMTIDWEKFKVDEKYRRDVLAALGH